jgi:hypothetical protein
MLRSSLCTPCPQRLRCTARPVEERRSCPNGRLSTKRSSNDGTDARLAAVGDIASGWKSLETSLKRWSADRVPHETINATWLRLKPFINWSGARAGAEHGIQADQVSDTAVENFIHETHRPSKAQKYRMPEQRLRHPWNLAGETVEGWSEVKLTVAPPREWLRSPIQSCAGPVRMR